MKTLFRAGRVHTPQPGDTDALLVEDGVVAWLGRADDTGPGAADRTVDLGGALVTPAFVDAHAHVTETGLLLRGVDLRPARNVTEILDLVAAAARRGDDPVLGHGWDETLLADGRAPTRTELDRAGAGAAVYLARIDAHSAVVSTALADACGAPGRQGWDDSGRVERAAHHAARDATRDRLSPSARAAAQRAALAAAAAAGIAAVHEMSAPHVAPEDDLRALVALTSAHPDAGPTDAGLPDAGLPDAGLPDVVPYRGELVDSIEQARAVVERLGLESLGSRLAGLAGDLVVDGSVGSRTAAYHDDYADRPGHRGHLYLTAEQVRDHVTACTRAGLQAGFHVIGDAAVKTALRGVRRAAGQVGIAAVRAARHRLEHVESLDDESVADLADLRVTASVQPAFDALWGGDRGLYAARLGVARALAMNPFGALARAGVALALGSDSPVTPFDPWGAVRACAAHHVPGQRLDPADALTAHTAGGWQAAGVLAVSADTAGGVLAVGAPATFAVWDVDGPLGADGLPVLDDDHRPPCCLLTVSRGRVLHDAR